MKRLSCNTVAAWDEKQRQWVVYQFQTGRMFQFGEEIKRRYDTIAEHPEDELFRLLTEAGMLIDGDAEEACSLPDKPDEYVLHLAAHRRAEAECRQKVRENAQRLLEMGRDGRTYAPVYSSLEGRLYRAYLNLTFRCPLCCPFCSVDAGNSDLPELSVEKFIHITEEICTAGFPSVAVTGGEPLVYEGFWDYARRLLSINRRGAQFILRTTLSFPQREEELALLCKAFDLIVVSIDGDEKTHDGNRGKGRYAQTLANLESAIAMGGRFGIQSVLTREQFQGAPGISVRALANRLGIQQLKIMAPLPLGRGACMPFKEQYLWIKEDRTTYSSPLFGCGLGTILCISPDGSVYPCYTMKDEKHLLGDLTRQSLHEIMENGALLKYLNRTVDTDPMCRNCDVRYLCSGMCRSSPLRGKLCEQIRRRALAFVEAK